MKGKKKSLAEIMYEQEEKDIERAIETLREVEHKKRDFMLKKLWALSQYGELYLPKCDFCGEDTKIVPMECTQPDVYEIYCCKCGRRQDISCRHIEQIYKLNRGIIDRFDDQQPKCKDCNSGFVLELMMDSQGGSFDMVCKNCGKHIH